jgi:hypothetical protein
MSQRPKTASHKRPSPSRRSAQLPPGKHAQRAPRLIGYGILALAALLIAIGSVIA